MSAAQPSDSTIEHRLLGMERRLFLPTLAIVAISFVLGVVIPFIDRQIPAGAFEAGARLEVHRLVEFSPAPGWIPDGVPAPASPELRIFREGVSLTVAAGAWQGSADELLSSILDTSHDYYQTGGDRRPFELPSGMQGIGINLYGIGNDGAIIALVAADAVGSARDDRGIGVRILIRGPAEILPNIAEEIAGMLRSFRPAAAAMRGKPGEPD